MMQLNNRTTGTPTTVPKSVSEISIPLDGDFVLPGWPILWPGRVAHSSPKIITTNNVCYTKIIEFNSFTLMTLRHVQSLTYPCSRDGRCNLVRDHKQNLYYCIDMAGHNLDPNILPDKILHNEFRWIQVNICIFHLLGYTLHCCGNSTKRKYVTCK